MIFQITQLLLWMLGFSVHVVLFNYKYLLKFFIEARDTMKERNVHYLASINPTRWSYLWNYLKPDLKKVGDFGVLWNNESCDAAMIFRDQNKALYILTDAFTPKETKTPPTTPPFRSYYKKNFNG